MPQKVDAISNFLRLYNARYGSGQNERFIMFFFRVVVRMQLLLVIIDVLIAVKKLVTIHLAFILCWMLESLFMFALSSV